MRVSELADTLQWERSRLSHQLSRMQRRGLDESEVDALARISDAALARLGAQAGPGRRPPVTEGSLDRR